MRILHFTDTHLFKDPDESLKEVVTDRALRSVVRHALKYYPNPDAVLLTGDLTHDGAPDAYHRLSEIFSEAGGPVFALPGNHDSRYNMASAFGMPGSAIQAGPGFFVGGWQVVMLDSTIQGAEEGNLSDAELDRLDKALGSHPSLPAIVCMHHHPVPMKSTWIDEIPLVNGDEFFEVLDRHHNVKAVLWGHVHQEYDVERNGVRLLSSPATCFQFAPRKKKFALEDTPAGYRWLELSRDGGIKTGVRRIRKKRADAKPVKPVKA